MKIRGVIALLVVLALGGLAVAALRSRQTTPSAPQTHSDPRMQPGDAPDQRPAEPSRQDPAESAAEEREQPEQSEAEPEGQEQETGDPRYEDMDD